MLRSTFIHLSRLTWAQQAITRSKLARRMAGRFVAGESVEDAIHAIGDLNQRGILATLDHLGENTASREDASRAGAEIRHILDEIEQSGCQANVSIKLSQIGLLVDASLCGEILAGLLEHARQKHNFIRIDMEDSSLVDRTLALYGQARSQGYDNTGVVIQSYLFRSEEDIQRLGKLGARVRLVKGAYQEPPEVAFPRKEDVDDQFDRLARLLIDQACEGRDLAHAGDLRFPPIPAIATHDPARITQALDYAEKVGLPAGAIEFQMLYGIRRDLQEQLAAQGHRVRVYVPYGTAWYPYFMRRLAERPANLWFFLSNAVQR